MSRGTAFYLSAHFMVSAYGAFSLIHMSYSAYTDVSSSGVQHQQKSCQSVCLLREVSVSI